MGGLEKGVLGRRVGRQPTLEHPAETDYLMLCVTGTGISQGLELGRKHIQT